MPSYEGFALPPGGAGARPAPRCARADQRELARGQLEAVSAADIQRYAAANLGTANRRLAVAGEASTFGAALKASEPGLVTVGQDALDLERSDGLSRR